MSEIKYIFEKTKQNCFPTQPKKKGALGFFKIEDLQGATSCFQELSLYYLTAFSLFYSQPPQLHIYCADSAVCFDITVNNGLHFTVERKII